MKAFIVSIIGLCAFSVFGQFQWPKASVGMIETITATVPVVDTNHIYVQNAGTAGFNSSSPYTLMAGAPNLGTASFLYTNIVGATTTNFIIAQFGGTSSGLGGVYDQKPFIMGTSTNNWGSGSAANGYAYFSAVTINSYWTNGDDIVGAGAGTGANPPPTVTYGTNTSSVTYTVYVNPNYFASQYTNGCVYVTTNGNDVLASNLQCAFQTCQAAKRFAPPGSTIYVAPGIYYDHDLLKNGVDWQFEKGTLVAWDLSQSDMTPHGIFDDYAGAVTSTITGDRMHFTAPAPINSWPIVLITNGASRITMTFNQIDYSGYAMVSGNSAYPGAPAFAPAFPGNSSVGLDVFNCAYFKLNLNLWSGFTNSSRQFLYTVAVGSANNFGTYTNTLPTDSGVSWAGGETHFNIGTLIVTNPGVLGVGYGFLSQNNWSAVETSCFLNCDFANAFMYWDDTNVKARTWLNIVFHMAPEATTLPALRYFGSGVHYYTAQKLSGDGPNVFETANNGTALFKLWANIEKITQDGAGDWISVTCPASTWWRVHYFEDNSGNTMTGGIKLLNGTNNFYGGNIVLSNASDVTINGGQAFLSGMNIQATGTNYPIAYLTPTISTGSNILSVQGCTLRSAAASCCIWATNLQGVYVYGNTNSSSCDVAATNLVHFTGIGL